MFRTGRSRILGKDLAAGIQGAYQPALLTSSFAALTGIAPVKTFGTWISCPAAKVGPPDSYASEGWAHMELFAEGFFRRGKSERLQFRLLDHILRNFGEWSGDVGFGQSVRSHCRSRIGIEGLPGRVVELDRSR